MMIDLRFSKDLSAVNNMDNKDLINETIIFGLGWLF